MVNKKKICIIDDDVIVARVLSKALKQEGYEVIEETGDFDNIIDKFGSSLPDVILLDIKLHGLSGMDILKELKQKKIDSPVIMLTGDVTAETAVKSMKLGAADYLTKPCDIEEMKIVINNVIENESLKREVNSLQRIRNEYLNKNIIGESPAIKELLRKIHMMVDARVSSILITGESGAGKEVFSRYIHELLHHNKSGNKPFIAVNCSAIPEYLLESELFGHEKGAFTDAKAVRKGVFELAHGGTLLLDEIGEMNINFQSKLLRVLEERVIRRLGGKLDIAVNVTVIACTNRNLSKDVQLGKFRSDLFFRLSQFYLHIPPIRERREDLPLLSRHFLMHYCSQYNNKTVKGFSKEAEKIMSSYSWPGNIRELRNCIEMIALHEKSEKILPEHLPDWIRKESTDTNKTPHQRLQLPKEGIALQEVKKDLFMQALKKAGNKKKAAAKLLNVSYDSLRYFIKKYGLK